MGFLAFRALLSRPRNCLISQESSCAIFFPEMGWMLGEFLSITVVGHGALIANTFPKATFSWRSSSTMRSPKAKIPKYVRQDAPAVNSHRFTPSMLSIAPVNWCIGMSISNVCFKLT